VHYLNPSSSSGLTDHPAGEHKRHRSARGCAAGGLERAWCQRIVADGTVALLLADADGGGLISPTAPWRPVTLEQRPDVGQEGRERRVETGYRRQNVDQVVTALSVRAVDAAEAVTEDGTEVEITGASLARANVGLAACAEDGGDVVTTVHRAD
jgi:hypothetical protein